VNAGNKPSKRRHVDARLSAVYAEADRWAERERERDLMAVLVEAGQLKSAARGGRSVRETFAKSRSTGQAHQSRWPSTSSRRASPRLGAPMTRISRPPRPAS
jgi:hypothetical protein